jgi:hypothetical protein
MESLQQQYSEVKPFASKLVPKLSAPILPSDAKQYARPVNFALQPISFSLPTSTTQSPFNSLPVASTSHLPMAPAVHQFEGPYNFALPTSFQQFLYEKFKQEFSTQGTRQSFYNQGASEYSAVHNSDVPQHLPPLGLSTKDPFEHTTTDDTSPSVPIGKLKSHRTSSKDLEAYDSGHSQLKPNLPQQLIVSKSTTLAPAKAMKKEAGAVRGRETKKSELSWHRGQEDKPHKVTKVSGGVGSVDSKLKTMPPKVEVETSPRVGARKTKHHKAEVETSPSVGAIKAKHHKAEIQTSPRADAANTKHHKAEMITRPAEKSKGAEGRRQSKHMQSSSTVETVKLPKLVKGRGGEVRKETKSEIRGSKDKPKYMPYSYNDYIKLKETPSKLGGIGPASVGTEKWHREMNKRHRMAEYTKRLKLEGDQTRSTDAIESHRTT